MDILFHTGPAEWMGHLQRRFLFTDQGHLQNNNQNYKKIEHFLVVLKRCSATGSFNRERNNFISINQQNPYPINKNIIL